MSLNNFLIQTFIALDYMSQANMSHVTHNETKTRYTIGTPQDIHTFVPKHTYWESLNSEETNRSNIEANQTNFIITVEQKFTMLDVYKTRDNTYTYTCAKFFQQ